VALALGGFNSVPPHRRKRDLQIQGPRCVCPDADHDCPIADLTNMTTMIAMTGAGEGVSANDGLRFDFGNVRVAGERQKLQWLPVPVSDLIWAGMVMAAGTPSDFRRPGPRDAVSHQDLGGPRPRGRPDFSLCSASPDKAWPRGGI
jgi:hypothetical protein